MGSNKSNIQCEMCQQEIEPVLMPKDIPAPYSLLQKLHTYQPVYGESDGHLTGSEARNIYLYNMQNEKSYTESSPNMLEYLEQGKRL